MNQTTTALLSTQALPDARTLHGRTLIVARSLWLAVASAALITFLCALPVHWANLTQPDALTQSHLDTLGLSTTLYAAWMLLWEVVMVAPWVATGLILFHRCGDQPMALLTSFMLVIFGVGSGILSPTLRALAGIAPALDLLLRAFEFLAWYSFTIFFYLFPNGRFVPRWTRTLALLWLPVYVLWNFAPDSPLAPLNWPPLFFVPFVGFLWLSLAFAQGYRYLRVSPEAERRQTHLVVLAALTIVALMIGTTAIGAFVPGYNLTTWAQPTPQAFAYILIQWPLVIFVALLPVAIAASILRYRLWQIDRLISRALVYGGLTFFVVLAYVGVVGSASALLPRGGTTALSLAVTGLIAVLFHPIQMRLQRGVNRLLYGKRDDPYGVLANLSHRLDMALDPPTLLQTIVETIRQALRLPGVAILLGAGAQSRVAAATGATGTDALVLPLLHKGEPVGVLHAQPRAPDEPFTKAERSLLQTIAAQVGIAVHNIQLTRDLQHSREQIVTAREEERRRLRRDLHDGLGPRLAGQTLKLEAARDALENDLATARELLDEMLAESQALISEIRRLVYGLRPPALDQLGLVTAIREQAAQMQRRDLVIVVDAPETLPPLPAAAEVAAFRIAQEALTNVARHARARRCTVVISVGDALQLEVADDGAGLPQILHAGVGLASMRERAEEIGGWWRVESTAPHGTRITAVLPLARGQDR